MMKKLGMPGPGEGTPSAGTPNLGSVTDQVALDLHVLAFGNGVRTFGSGTPNMGSAEMFGAGLT